MTTTLGMMMAQSTAVPACIASAVTVFPAEADSTAAVEDSMAVCSRPRDRREPRACPARKPRMLPAAARSQPPRLSPSPGGTLTAAPAVLGSTG
jgi:hypothetical protein